MAHRRPLRVYWYWPHPHRTASPLLLAALRPGDEFVVQAIPTFRGESLRPIAEYEIVRDLPDPTRRTPGVPRLVRPLELTYRRSRARRRLARRGFDLGIIESLVYQVDWIDLRGVQAGLPLVSVVHDVRPHVRALPEWLETALLRRLYREETTGELIVYSPLLRDELVADYGVDPHRVHVLPLPIDASDGRSADSPRPARPMALFFGSLRPNKGLPILLAALEQLPADPGFDVVVAGGGDAATSEMLTRAADRRRYLSVELGFVDASRKAELHNQASLMLLPYTEFHSVSGVFADAYSYRLPILASDAGSLGDIVGGDGTGWVVPKGDPAALADALMRAIAALDTETEREALVARITEAAKRHDYAVVGPQWRDICDVAVERARRHE
jgi:glycosyltransferase involved in cell wall biosynthesis